MQIHVNVVISSHFPLSHSLTLIPVDFWLWGYHKSWVSIGMTFILPVKHLTSYLIFFPRCFAAKFWRPYGSCDHSDMQIGIETIEAQHVDSIFTCFLVFSFFILFHTKKLKYYETLWYSKSHICSHAMLKIEHYQLVDFCRQ